MLDPHGRPQAARGSLRLNGRPAGSMQAGAQPGAVEDGRCRRPPAARRGRDDAVYGLDDLSEGQELGPQRWEPTLVGQGKGPQPVRYCRSSGTWARRVRTEHRGCTGRGHPDSLGRPRPGASTRGGLLRAGHSGRSTGGALPAGRARPRAAGLAPEPTASEMKRKMKCAR